MKRSIKKMLKENERDMLAADGRVLAVKPRKYFDESTFNWMLIAQISPRRWMAELIN